jgi:metal-responsive CopG/Arc/MetJ family transcriptional regulator
MKTAISLPDALYVDAEKTAKSMGIPRSQLFAIALEEFINHHKKERITDQLNDVYKNMEEGNPSSMNEVNLISMRELTKNDTW